jgi:hypothetical protein
LVFALKTEAISELRNKVVEEKRFLLLEEKKSFRTVGYAYRRAKVARDKGKRGP